MRKLGIIVLISCISVFFFSCKKDLIDEPIDNGEINNPTENEPINENPIEKDPVEDPIVDPIPEKGTIEFNDADLKLAVNSEYSLNLEITGNVNYIFEYDGSIISVEDKKLTALNTGTTELALFVDGEKIKVISVFVYNPPVNLSFVNVPSKVKVGDKVKISLSSSKDVEISVSSDIAEYDASTKMLSCLSAGEIILTATYKHDSSIFATKTITIEKKYLTPSQAVVNSKYSNLSSGDKVEIGDYQYTYGKNLFSKIADAVSVSSDILVESTTETAITISKSNIKLTGACSENCNIKINLASGVKGVTIKGFVFTKDSKIVLMGNNTDITIKGNSFIQTTATTKAWEESKNYTSGVIELTKSDTYHNNIVIEDNLFDSIGDCGINVNTTHNISFINNTFRDFKYDGIRLNDGVIKSQCSWRFIGNEFTNSSYSGIYFRTYASDGVSYWHFVDIKDNKFTNLGSNSVQYSGAIVFRNYQEGYACVDISYNSFNSCSKFIFLRNNAVEKNQSNFVGYVVGNVFETVPATYYFNNLNSSDSFTLNPKQTKLLDNLFLDGSGNVITPDSSKFIGNASNEVITQSAYEKLVHIDFHHVIRVDEEVSVSYDFVPVDSSFISINNGKMKALKQGITKLMVGETAFEIKCIAKLDLVVKFINIALGEVGYQEMDANGKTGTSGNYTKYGAWYGINPGAWCAMYVSWCANQAGVPTNIIPKYASVQIGMDWYKNKGLFQYKESYTPKAGDIMFMKSNGASHTGIVLYCDGTTLYTVEGNTSDMCACRKYSVTNSKITGYGTPEWPYYSPDGYNFSSGEPQDGSGHSTT